MKKKADQVKGLSNGVKAGIVGSILYGLLVTSMVGFAASLPPAATKTSEPASVVSEPAGPVITTNIVEVKSPVEFETTNQDDSSLAKGSTKVVQEGQNGERTIKYEVTLTDGKETERKEISNEITKPAVAKITAIGTYVAPPPRSTPPKPNCHPSYSGCVPNVSYDLDCSDIGQRVRVIGPDVFRLDADKDGIGCDSY